MKINDNCIACGDCVEVCVSDAIDIMPRKGKSYSRYFINQKKCKGCGECLAVCSNWAIDE